jgi:pullulanase
MTASYDGSGFDSPELVRLALNKLCAALVLTSQGMSFFQAGEEFGRSKYCDGNSYCSDSHINMLDWSRTVTFAELIEYYKGLIAIRRSFSGFTDESGAGGRSIRFIRQSDQVVAYTIEGQKDGEPRLMLLIFNAGAEGVSLDLQELTDMPLPAKWNVLAGETYAGVKPLYQVEGSRFYVYTRGVLIAASAGNIGGEEKPRNDE